MSDTSVLDGIRVIDGGLASELEYQGARIDGPLWSAHVLEDEPEKLVAVHRAYIAAGAECLATCSYQVSRMGYAEVGFSAERADAALLRSVELARTPITEFPGRRVLVAGSLGPYGAALHNGGEYHGNYDCSYADLVKFHRERIAVFADAPEPQRPDLLAFETFPSLEEARAVGEAMEPWPELRAWFSFSCPRRDACVARRERGRMRGAGCFVSANRGDWRELRSAALDSCADWRIAQAAPSCRSLCIPTPARDGMRRGVAGRERATRRSLERRLRSGSALERKWWEAAAAHGQRISPKWRGRRAKCL